MPRANLLIPASLLALTLSPGCATPDKQAANPMTTQAEAEAAQPQPLPELPCPLALEGVTVSAAEIGGGIAMSFTSRGDLLELHRRIEALAERHNLLTAPKGLASAAGGNALITLPGTRARTELLETGVALVFLPEKREDLYVLRAQVNRRVALMQQSGSCAEEPLPAH